jgi:hypothetical protein
MARNVLCPSYSSCLSAAVKLNLPGFDCLGCIHLRDHEPVNPHEARNAGVLLALLFLPELYQEYHQDLLKQAENMPEDGLDEHSLIGVWDGWG